jgi:hypothetical protein
MTGSSSPSSSTACPSAWSGGSSSGIFEGRRTSELLLAGLSLSFIIASGVVKDFGRALMDGGVAQWWQMVPVVGSAVGSALGKVGRRLDAGHRGFPFPCPCFWGRCGC